ncbi:hypothetical protein VB796_08655 [Arcicella sp. LKC2W]|uniref:hypothetical protein n=1 Tax=Arcicella sp. LKC2W TaxID=2984198 RepID=UPI002B2176D2|nr:hypothetical protein [Arcicella sp. LKC2W]MEA5459104.1 hypothetical protein [Arcicella sp. LKC2W]
MLRIEIDNQEFKIEQDINKLTAKTLIKIAEMSLLQLDESRFRFFAFLAMLEQSNPKWQVLKLKLKVKLSIKFSKTKIGQFLSKFINLKVYNLANEHNSEFISHCTDFYFSRRNEIYTAPIQKIQCSIFGFYSGMSDFGETFSFGQFWQATVAFLEYQSNPSSDNFRSLLSLLFPKFRLWFFRLSDSNAVYFWRFTRISDPTKQVILWSFSGIINQIMSEFPNAFVKSKSTNEINVEETRDSWLDTLDNISGSPDKYDTFNDLNVRYVLRHLDKTIKENKAQKEELEKLKK